MNLFTKFIFTFVLIHSFLMLVDEFYFHRKRGLVQWERIGHPIDTLFTLICFTFVIFFPITKVTVIAYAVFSIVSSFIIIKDETVHLKYCENYEQFLHAILFVSHPVLLISLFLCWSSFSISIFPFMNYFSSYFIKILVIFQFISIIVFFIYQIFYWNFFRKGDTYVKKSRGK